MRFLIFSTQYYPTVGGVERYTQNLADTLQTKGHQVLIVTSALPNLPAEETQQNGVQLLRVASFLPMGGRLPILKPGAISEKNIPFLYNTHFDFALINTRFYPLSLFASKFCKKQKIPAIVLEHGSAYLSLSNPFIDKASHLYEKLAIRYVKKYCQNFYGVSSACVTWLQHFNISAKGVLYNAVNPEPLQAIAKKCTTDYRQKYSLPADTPLIVFSGRFIVEKGIFELLDAFTLLQKNSPNAVLLLAGNGPCYDEIVQKKQENVICTGMLSFEESIALLSQATVFCLPSYSEGFSTVILEVAAVKTAIITTPTGGSPELLLDDSYGILLTDKEPKTIATALQTALANREWRTTAAQKTYENLSQNFTWQKTADHFLEIVEENLS